MRFYGEKVDDKPEYPEYNGDNSPATDGYPYDEEIAARCPPHTTERKLVTRIDFHVIPFLCIMYCMAHPQASSVAHAKLQQCLPSLTESTLATQLSLV
jgi:hypothetical protein